MLDTAVRRFLYLVNRKENNPKRRAFDAAEMNMLQWSMLLMIESMANDPKIDQDALAIRKQNVRNLNLLGER